MKKKKKNPSVKKEKTFKHQNPFKEKKSELLNLVKQVEKQKKQEKFSTNDVKVSKKEEFSDDTNFMKNLFSDIKPINSDDRVPAVKKTKKPQISKQQFEIEEPEHMPSGFIDSDEGFSDDFNIEFLDEFVSGVAPGVDLKFLNKLKKGEYSYQSYLDLHGYTWDEAKDAIMDLIISAQRDGKRCVLIVHGRGLHSKTHHSVLKTNLVNMLTKGPLRKKILAFSTALPVHGGPGSIYILLRRPKSSI